MRLGLPSAKSKGLSGPRAGPAGQRCRGANRQKRGNLVFLRSLATSKAKEETKYCGRSRTPRPRGVTELLDGPQAIPWGPRRGTSVTHRPRQCPSQKLIRTAAAAFTLRTVPRCRMWRNVILRYQHSPRDPSSRSDGWSVCCWSAVPTEAWFPHNSLLFYNS